MKYNILMAFPYVALSPEEAMENLLVSGFKETCGHDLDVTKVSLLGLCPVQEDGSPKISDLQSLHVE